MSAPNDQAGPAGQMPGSLGRVTADGRRMYRLTAPVVVWWSWVVVALVAVGDLIIQGHDLISLKFTFGLLTITGLVYACTLWPRVFADEASMTVQNPFRTFHIPWGSVTGIFLADSVEVKCARPSPKKDKTVYSWALTSPRRARARAAVRGSMGIAQSGIMRRSMPSSYGQRLEATGASARAPSPADLMARELARMSQEAQAKMSGTLPVDVLDAADNPTGGDEGADQVTDSADDVSDENNENDGALSAVMSARWAWQPLAAVLVPGVAFVIAQLVK